MGLCILNGKKGFATSMEWNESIFIELLAVILDTIGGTTPSQFVQLAFLTFDNVKHLKDALKKLGRWHNIFMGGLTYV